MRRTTWLHLLVTSFAIFIASSVSADDGHAIVPKAVAATTVAGNYGIAFPAPALYDLSGLGTQLIGPDQDFGATGANDIGFDFFFQGVPYQQFSVNSNGLLKLGAGVIQFGFPYQALGQAGQALITAYAADQRTHAGDGEVRYALLGSAPSRVLVVEWLNMQSDGAPAGTADLHYQVRLLETVGVIEFAYGAMAMSPTGAANANSKNVHIGFSSGSTAGTIGSISAPLGGFPSFDPNSTPAQVNTYGAGPMPGLANRTILLSPPAPVAPTSLSFTAVTATSMTLNWIDSPDEELYAIYRSADGVNYILDGVAAKNATSYAATVLTPETTWAWKVYAVSEGALSAALTGQQLSGPSTVRTSVISGTWTNPATWGGSVPGLNDTAVIAAGHTVTMVNVSPTVFAVTVQGTGTLKFDTSAGQTLQTNGPLTIAANGTLTIDPASNSGNFRIRAYGNVINNGTLNLAPTVTSFADLVFNGSYNASMTLGASSVTRLSSVNGLIVAKTVAAARPIVSFTPGGTFTVQGVANGGFLFITAGEFRIVGTNAFTSKLFAAAAWAINAQGSLHLDNANAVVTAQAGSATVNGALSVANGALNVGTATNDSLVIAKRASFAISGGTVNVAGRLGVATDTDPISYAQSGGTVSVCRVGNSSTTAASFDLGKSSGSSVSMSGGTIELRFANSSQASGPGDYRHEAGSGPASVTGGTVRFGNAPFGGAQQFRASGILPDVVVDNAQPGHSLEMGAPSGSNQVGNVTINPTSTFDTGPTPLRITGPTFTNNGTLDARDSRLIWARSNGAQTYTGSGTATPPVLGMNVENGVSLTMDPASPSVTVRTFQLVSGNVINTGNIILGNGDSVGAEVYIGSNSTPSAAGSFDAPFAFNLGTGGLTVGYLRTATARITGPEIPPGSTLSLLIYDDNDPTHSLTLSGGGLNLAGGPGVVLGLINGRIVTGAGNSIYLSTPGANVFRQNGWVDGTVKKRFASPALLSFEVGSANGYSPVDVLLTNGTFPTDFAVTAHQGPYPNFDATLGLKRWWTLNGQNVTAGQVTFNWLDPADLPTAAPESALVLYNQNGGIMTPGGAVSAASNSALIQNVTSFGAWTLAMPLSMNLQMAHVGSAFTKGQSGAQYQIKVTNTSAVPVPKGTVITVRDTLPAALTFVSATGTGWTCGAAGQDVTCTATQSGGVPFEGSAESLITLTVNVAANAPSTIENTATCNCNLTEPELNAWTDTVNVNPVLGSGIALTVSQLGSGSGQVTDPGNTINCGSFCSNNYPAGTTLTLTATPSAGSVFAGWQGACTGTATCTVTINAATTVSATFALSSIGVRILDIDGNGQYDALTDGLLVIRYLFGLTGPALTANAIATGASRSSDAAILAYLHDIRPRLDVDRSGIAEAGTDGLLIVRNLFGVIGSGLVQGAIGSGATRSDPVEILNYLSTLKP